LAELVAKLDGIGVLGLPTNEAWPVGEEGFVDDLDSAGWFVFIFANFV
jgi:hypothetical protein